jgi:1-aminocyclopropane-1-carboxylate deaminase/D-cysteine desulfhydrase-like pyridoxal-dependent ACC family enzyme
MGGYQSNHARATAACARLLGLEPHLVLFFREAQIRDAFIEKPHLEGPQLARLAPAVTVAETPSPLLLPLPSPLMLDLRNAAK